MKVQVKSGWKVTGLFIGRVSISEVKQLEKRKKKHETADLIHATAETWRQTSVRNKNEDKELKNKSYKPPEAMLKSLNIFV